MNQSLFFRSLIAFVLALNCACPAGAISTKIALRQNRPAVAVQAIGTLSGPTIPESRIRIMNNVGPISPEALGFIQGLSPLPQPLPPLNSLSAALEIRSGLNSLSSAVEVALKQHDTAAAHVQLQQKYDHKKPAGAAGEGSPVSANGGAGSSSGGGSSGTTWTQSQIKTFVRNHKRQIIAVLGVNNLRVETLHGLPYLIVSVRDSYGLYRTISDLEKTVPKIRTLKGMLGTPNQLLYESVRAGSLNEKESGLIQPQNPAPNSDRSEDEGQITQAAEAYFKHWLADRYPQYRLLGINPGVGLAVYHNPRTESSTGILILVASDGSVSHVTWGSTRYLHGE